MIFKQRFYSGQNFLPKPVVDIEKTTNTLIVATPWGSPELARSAIHMIKDQIGTVSEETEITRVTQVIEGLSDEGNQLRSAAMFTNENIFLRDNAKEYTGGVELALISVQNQFLSWVQIGTPHVLLRNDRGFHPICYTPDWSWQLKQKAPLVSKALGMERSCYLNCGTHRFEKQDHIFLISRSTLPAQIYGFENSDLDSLSKVLIDNDPDTPFWIAQLHF
jgi:hypothetical protein